MPYHKQGAYDGFDALAEATEHYKRCRTRKHFILSEIAAADLPCSVCRALIKDGPDGQPASPGYQGNRCEYLPRRKQVQVMHYLCAWNNLTGKIYKN